MFCTNCGTRMEDDMLFCPNCGTKVHREEPKPAEEVKPAEVAEEVKPAEEAKAVESAPEPVPEVVPEIVAETQEPAPQPSVEDFGQTADLTGQEPTPSVQEIAAEPAPEAQVTVPEPVPAMQEIVPEIVPEVQETAPEPVPQQSQAAYGQTSDLTGQAPTPGVQMTGPGPEVYQAAYPGQTAQTPEGYPGQAAQMSEAYPPQAAPMQAQLPKASVGKGILSVLLCMIVFLFVLAGSLLLVTRLSLSEKQIRKTMGSIDVSEITMPSMDGRSEIPLMDFLEETSGFNFEKTAGIEKSKLLKFMGKSYVVDMTTDYLVSYVQYFLSGKMPMTLSRDDVVEFVKKHNDDLVELTGFSFCYQGQVYTKDIDNAFKDLGTDEISIGWIEKEAGISHAPIKFILSILCVSIIGGLAFLLILLVLIMNAKTTRSGMAYVGMTMLLDGVVMLIVAGIGYLRRGDFHSNLISSFVTPFLFNFMIIGGSLFIVGLLFFLIGMGKKKRLMKKAGIQA
ncbi:MAG: zinc-ribbon domain-containing protein [Lachnospiraceae bacterium]|nr:zinc-ribbon domain-containing protein [Lachnospiraceae bacterium]